MAEPFGSAGGTSAAIQDMARLSMTQGQNIQNQQAALNLSEQQRMASLAQQQAADPASRGKSPVEQMEDMARLAMGSGMVASGTKLATDASKIRLNTAQTSRANSQSVNQQALAAKTELEMTDRLLSGVKDEDSWNAANALFEQMTGRKSPLDGVPYNPALVQQLQQSTLTMKDRIDLHIKQYNADTARANQESNSNFREFRKGILRNEEDLRQQREDRLRKQGGKTSDVGVPGKTELDHAADSITGAFPDLPTEEVNNAAYTLASRARAIRKTTPGLDADAAMDRALAEAKAAGQFQTLNDTYHVLGMDTGVSKGPTTHFKKSGNVDGSATGNTQANPFTDIPAADKRVVGGYYKHGGKTYQWNKGGWSLVGGGDAGTAE